MANETQVAVRIPEGYVERADALAEVLAEVPEFELQRMSRAAVLRFAIKIGLEALERKHR